MKESGTLLTSRKCYLKKYKIFDANQQAFFIEIIIVFLHQRPLKQVQFIIEERKLDCY